MRWMQYKERIESYLKGTSNEKEIEFIEKLFGEGEKDYTLKQLLKDDWDKIQEGNENINYNLYPLLDRIHHEIRLKENSKRNPAIKRVLQVYVKVAAAIFIPLLIGVGLLTNNIQKEKAIAFSDQSAIYEIIAPLGSRVKFTLPDGTKGMLNSESRLSYILPFSNNRIVELEGEGWFEVISDNEHPFLVKAGESNIKAVGTSFNVSAYPAENYVEVVLSEGIVEFTDDINPEKVVMKPEELLIFEDGKIETLKVDPEKYSAWTEGKLVFREDPMQEVCRRIGRWYNVEVILADKELEKYSFRATFQDDTLDDVFRYLSMTTPIRYTITPRQMLSDGTYSKEIVTLYINKP